MKQIYANNFTTLSLGRQGENIARKVVFDVRDLESLYGPGDVEVIYQRPGDAQPYPLAVQMDGTLVTWDVTATDTEMSDGYGKCELRYYVGETLAKSKTWLTWVEPALPTPSETAPPEQEQGWVDKVIEAGAEAKQAADRAEYALDKAPIINDDGNWCVWDSAAGEYADTGRYSGGSSPYIGSNGNWFIGSEDSGVSATGPVGPAGKDGKDGMDGLPGKDGVDGQPGKDGKDGIDGQPGKDGKDGVDGLTPTIGDNGNWYLGDTDTGKPSRGEVGPDGAPGKDGAQGEKGDPFTYEDFTEEQLAALKGDPGPKGDPGQKGDTGESGLPNVLSISGAEIALTLANNTETRCTDAVTALTVSGFSAGEDGKAEQWGLVFTAGDSITVTVPDTLIWAVAEPIFTAGATYWLSMVPLADKYLAVWTEVVADESATA